MTDPFQLFLTQLKPFSEITIVGPLAAKRESWPEPAIFVDGGSRHQTDSLLHFSVGDGDSADHEVDFLLPEEKDFSDLAYVLKNIPDHIERLSMVGFLGGRRDHEFINFGEIHRFLRSRTKKTECDLDWAVCAFSSGRWPLKLTGFFSLVAMEDATVTITGDCRYSLPNPTEIKALSSHGLSNEASGVVEITCDLPVFIFKNPFS